MKKRKNEIIQLFNYFKKKARKERKYRTPQIKSKKYNGRHTYKCIGNFIKNIWINYST
jgi:DNA-binding NtrC family response regulator